MNPRSTWFFVIAAVLLAAYISLSNRHRGNGVPSAGGRVEFTSPRAQEIVEVQLVRSNLAVRAERVGGTWRLHNPDYPAQVTGIENLLQAVEKLRPINYITAEQWRQQPEGRRQMGLEKPGTLTIQTRSGPWILQLGGMSPLGNRFYFQQVGDDGVYVADNSFLAALPHTVADWRNHSLVDLEQVRFDRIEIAGRAQLEAVREPGGRWRLIRPLEARASSEQFQNLIETIQRTEVTSFVSDSPAVPLDDFGLQTPVAQVVFKLGTNEVSRLQFGRAPTNAPGEIYIRRTANTNIVQANADAAPLLLRPLSAFRDKQLLPSLEGATRVEIVGTGPAFAVDRSGTNWFLGGTNRLPADAANISACLRALAVMRIEDYVDDVVADPSRYGFDQPRRRYSIFGTNGLLATLLIGVPYGTQNRVYAKRADEPSAYGIPAAYSTVLPQFPAQLRSWRFDPTNVVRITVEEKGEKRVVERSPVGDWKFAGNSLGVAASLGIDEAVYGVSQLNSQRFPAPPDAVLPGLGFTEVNHHITIELGGTSGFKTLRLEFGGRTNAVTQYALAQLDDSEPVLIEISLSLYLNLIRPNLSLGNSPRSAQGNP
ncbi:MAG TPA: DUF4340 domain-containing protein [Candidatus Limnocylindria bacterium]|jgi:hypothetical protein|nr:DUF4340 domain-containing protein [Candidatus Limnocylindria bacterium]